MYGVEWLIVLALLGLALGIGVGFLIGGTGIGGGRKKQLQEQLAQSQQELAAYRQEVVSQFSETARKFQTLNDAYTDLHQQLAHSSTVLCKDVAGPLLVAPTGHQDLIPAAVREDAAAPEAREEPEDAEAPEAAEENIVSAARAAVDGESDQPAAAAEDGEAEVLAASEGTEEAIQVPEPAPVTAAATDAPEIAEEPTRDAVAAANEPPPDEAAPEQPQQVAEADQLEAAEDSATTAPRRVA